MISDHGYGSPAVLPKHVSNPSRKIPLPISAAIVISVLKDVLPAPCKCQRLVKVTPSIDLPALPSAMPPVVALSAFDSALPLNKHSPLPL